MMDVHGENENEETSVSIVEEREDMRCASSGFINYDGGRFSRASTRVLFAGVSIIVTVCVLAPPGLAAGKTAYTETRVLNAFAAEGFGRPVTEGKRQSAPGEARYWITTLGYKRAGTSINVLIYPNAKAVKDWSKQGFYFGPAPRVLSKQNVLVYWSGHYRSRTIIAALARLT